MKNSKISDEDVVKQFKWRRLRLLLIFFPGFISLFVLLAINVSVKIFFCVLLIWFPVAGWYLALNYRCPRCNAVPWNPSGPGVTLVPYCCSQCKAPLNESFLKKVG